MRKRLPIFYSALLLTLVNLLLRFAGTSFQVYLSSRIGAEGIGLLQLVLSVGSMALVAGMAGIRTATMYLTAEEIGRKRPQNITWVLSGCTLYSILCSGAVAVGVYYFAPVIAEKWIGNTETTGACCAEGGADGFQKGHTAAEQKNYIDDGQRNVKNIQDGGGLAHFWHQLAYIRPGAFCPEQMHGEAGAFAVTGT